MIFKDRTEAGQLLAKQLSEFEHHPNALIFAIPRGGVVVGYEIAKSLNLPLGVVITRKIAAPRQKELAVGSIDPDGEIIWHAQLLEDLNIEKSDLNKEIEMQKKEIIRRLQLYQPANPPDPKHKTIILVDDGIATGLTILSAIRYLKKKGADKIIVATPVTSTDSLEEIINNADIVALQSIKELGSVGNFYQSFLPVSDEQVITLLKNC